MRIPDSLANAMTAAVGSLVGISLGLMCGVVHASTVLKHWLETLVCAIVGYLLSSAMKHTLRRTGFVAGQYTYLAVPPKRRLAWSLMTVAGTIMFAAFDIACEHQGIFAFRSAQESLMRLSGSVTTSPDAWITWLAIWLAAATVTAAYLLGASIDGYIAGRAAIVSSRVASEQYVRRSESDAAFRARPEIRNALERLMALKALHRSRSELLARIAATAKPFEDQIRDLSARRLTAPAEMTDDEKKLVKDATDDFVGAQMWFDDLLEKALKSIHDR